MSTAFDLTSEPWIPCLEVGARVPSDLSLRDTLAHAHELEDVVDASPLVRVSLLRLLLAVLHRVVDGPTSIDEWRELHGAGRWDEAALDRYLGTWRTRFDLLDDAHPFFQIVEEPGAKTVPVIRMRHELASGNNTTLFDHTTEERPPRFSLPEAARSLVATQAFALGGGKSEPFYLSDAPLARGFTVMARGSTLLETLLLNLMPHTSETPLPGSDDLPSWEQDEPAVPDRNGTPPRGYLDYLTWQPRAVRLIREPGDTGVRWCTYHQNLKLPAGFHGDPFVAYRKDEQRGWVVRRLRAGRSLWRDSEAILTDSLSHGPSVLDWLRRVSAASGHRTYRLTLAGLGSPGQAKIDFWRAESLPLPDAYLDDADLRLLLQGALSDADQASRLLRNSVRRLGEELGIGRDGMAAFIEAQRVNERYWPSLEGSFQELLASLAEGWRSGGADGTLEPLARWKDRVVETAVTALEQVTASYDTTARELRAAAIARRRIAAIRALRDETMVAA